MGNATEPAPDVAPDGRRAMIEMTVDVGDVLARHGYQLDARGLGELRQHLWHLLCGRGTECTGGGR